jgi:hypothetical protein
MRLAKTSSGLEVPHSPSMTKSSCGDVVCPSAEGRKLAMTKRAITTQVTPVPPAARLLGAGIVGGDHAAPPAVGFSGAPPGGDGESWLIFDAEWVRLDVEGESLVVRGTFLLLCREPIEESVPLFFPFPRDSLLGEARMVSLRFRVAGDARGPGRWEEVPGNSGVRWWMPPCRGDSLVAEFVYRQEIHAEYARYIVTSARLWGRPLRYAAFEIGLPPGVEPLDFSYPFERRVGGEGTYYSWETEEFFPDRDIVVRWRR